jgi:hypothetical protein
MFVPFISPSLPLSPLTTLQQRSTQVDLSTSSIRPGKTAPWFCRLKSAVLASVSSSTASVRICTGSWQHDLDQANLLAHLPNVVVKPYQVDSHRLALVLAGRQQLMPILREAILQEMGLQSGNIRLANLL